MTSVRGIRCLTMAVSIVAILSGAERVAKAQDLTVTFPRGWAVTNLPVTSADGQRVAGGTSRAILASQTGKPLAAIELTQEPQPSGSLRDLQASAKQIQAGAGDVYRKAGLELSCLPPRSVQVAGASGLDIQCDAGRDSRVFARQRIVVWSKPGMLASLSYTSSAREFAANIDAFRQTLASVTAD